jgi:hypothetical protein
MHQSITQKDVFYFLGHPVNVRIYGDGNQAHAEISGFNLAAPLTAEQLNDLGDWLKSIADQVEDFERNA